MNKKIIRKRQDSWYNKRYPWNLVYDLAVYLRDSLRGYILWLENSSDAVNKDKKLYIFTPDDIEGKLPLPYSLSVLISKGDSEYMIV